MSYAPECACFAIAASSECSESVRKLYQAVGSFDAVAIAAGQVAFAPLSELTAEKWQFSLGSKLMRQINLVQEAIPFIKEKGSFTLVSGILNDDHSQSK
ncbi:MAG TPA: hypothetical protein VKT22_09215 [Steroidobacteraceae bacterium]|nr:hypothetical protein [Steroidobacteraceae bacterium]